MTLELKARKILPDPSMYEGNYINVEVPLKEGMHDVVTFAKQEKDGAVYWTALPYAR